MEGKQVCLIHITSNIAPEMESQCCSLIQSEPYK